MIFDHITQTLSKDDLDKPCAVRIIKKDNNILYAHKTSSGSLNDILKGKWYNSFIYYKVTGFMDNGDTILITLKDEQEFTLTGGN